jgi:hypothetical protein
LSLVPRDCHLTPVLGWLAQKYHPDKGGDAEKFKELKKAYDVTEAESVDRYAVRTEVRRHVHVPAQVLGDPEKRQKYDACGLDSGDDSDDDLWERTLSPFLRRPPATTTLTSCRARDPGLQFCVGSACIASAIASAAHTLLALASTQTNSCRVAKLRRALPSESRRARMQQRWQLSLACDGRHSVESCQAADGDRLVVDLAHLMRDGRADFATRARTSPVRTLCHARTHARHPSVARTLPQLHRGLRRTKAGLPWRTHSLGHQPCCSHMA